MIYTAIVRKPAPNFADGLTTSSLGKPSYPLVLEQHAAYVETLGSLNIEVECLEPLPAFPDAYFVEDPAIVLPKIAVITNPASDSRKGEKDAIAPVLSKYRDLVYIQNPGTLEGGDVFCVGAHYYIGISDRTNGEGARQLGRILESQGMSWTSVPVDSGLHLKSSVNYVGQNTLLTTQDFADHLAFAAYQKIIVKPNEALATNTIWVNNHLIMPAGYPQAYEALKELGVKIIILNMSEVEKMDGGLTCLSLRF